MSEVVSHSRAAVVSVLLAVGRHIWNPTSRIRASGAVGTKTKEIAPIAKVTTTIEASCAIPRIERVSTTPALTLRKNVNVAIVKVMRPKTVQLASYVSKRDIFDVTAAVGPNLHIKATCAWAAQLRNGSPSSQQWISVSQFSHEQQRCICEFSCP